ncbi:MAG: heme-binding protein [Methylocystaceae bacterium]|nr:heme-binding protein [Methylocystaceae bacterium]NBV94810.1 heme-binding protein [Methylocystaceae bacterium]
MRCVLAALFILIAGAQVKADSDVEHARYSVVSNAGDIEIRDYPAQIIAETTVSGERSSAISEGFRRLAGYIFGGNQPGEKIAMTAPVGQTSAGENWRVTFTMPASYSMKTLPKPTNQAVQLIELPPQRLAAIRFSGLVDEDDLAQNQAKLMRFLEQQKLKPIGAPRYAFYDPPWTLPFNRRNEVLIEIARP